MAKLTRRDFLKMAAAAGMGIAAFASIERAVQPRPDEKPKPMTETTPTPYTWVRFLAGTDEAALNTLAADGGDRVNRYRVREVVPVAGDVPANLAQSRSVLRIETTIPISLEPVYSDSAVLPFYGVTQNLHYTSEEQRQELARLARPEPPASENTVAVLIPIGKSEEWWKLAQDRRQAYFHKDGDRPGHTAIGARYVDRVFRKLYHSRYLNAALGYDFLTYFEFEDAYADDFRTLLAELRDTSVNPEWAYVNREFEVWMTKIA